MVSATSLNNLIPMPSKWGVATKAIRVPIEFLEDIYTMIEDKIEQLKFTIGNDAPADQTEDEWVAEITGLPVDFDPDTNGLPTEIVETIAEVKQANLHQDQNVAETKQEKKQKKVRNILESFTPDVYQDYFGGKEWANNHGYGTPSKPTKEFKKYLNQRWHYSGEYASAREDLDKLKAKGWNIGTKYLH